MKFTHGILHKTKNSYKIHSLIHHHKKIKLKVLIGHKSSNLIIIQSSKLKSLHQRSDRRPTLESEQMGKTPSESRRRNFYASSEGRTAHLLERGKRKGNSTSPVENPITKSLLVKPIISPVIHQVSF